MECEVNGDVYSSAEEYARYGDGDVAAQEYLSSIGAHELSSWQFVRYRNGSWHQV